eukprot:Pgem_evm1s7606
MPRQRSSSSSGQYPNQRQYSNHNTPRTPKHLQAQPPRSASLTSPPQKRRPRNEHQRSPVQGSAVKVSCHDFYAAENVVVPEPHHLPSPPTHWFNPMVVM